MKHIILLPLVGFCIVTMLTISMTPAEAKTWPYVYYRANGKIDEYNPILPGNVDRIIHGSWTIQSRDGWIYFKANYLEENGPGPEIEGTFDKIRLNLTDVKSILIKGRTGFCEVGGTLAAYRSGWDPATGKRTSWFPLFSYSGTRIVVTESELRIYLPIPDFTEWAVRGSTLSIKVLFLLH